MTAPLEGLRIIDLSMFMSGPLVTLIAADLGADVIKVESLQRLDGWRGASAGDGDAPPWETSPAFNWINRNKRDVTINLADARGSALLKRLVAIGDVVIENFTPRVMANFGLTYEELRAVKPDIIMISMPGFGLDGPWRDYTSFAWPTEQMAGISHITGYEGGPPLFTNSTGGDPLAGLMGALALFAALQHRRRTGEGQHIDLSQLEASTMFTGDVLMGAAYGLPDPGRQGNKSATMAPHNVYRCAGASWLAIACRSDREWACLATVMGRQELAADGARHRTIAGRLARRDEIDAIVQEWAATMDAHAAMHLLQANGVAAGVVLDGRQLLEDPHLAARSFFVEQQRQWVDTKHYPGEPFRLSGYAWPEAAPAPLLGEHNGEVLGGLLNLSEPELAELERADIVGTMPIAARERRSSAAPHQG